jgi:hypothetical protein
MIGQVGASRPAYYDRNPLAVYQSYSSNAIAPAAVVVRATYTVPSGKKAFCETLHGFARRRTAAAPVGTWSVGINVTPSGGSNTTILYKRDTKNVIDDQKEFTISPFGELGAGDKIDLITEDLSTGGTVDYTFITKAVEFDA